MNIVIEYLNLFIFIQTHNKEKIKDATLSIYEGMDASTVMVSKSEVHFMLNYAISKCLEDIGLWKAQNGGGFQINQIDESGNTSACNQSDNDNDEDMDDDQDEDSNEEEKNHERNNKNGNQEKLEDNSKQHSNSFSSTKTKVSLTLFFLPFYRFVFILGFFSPINIFR